MEREKRNRIICFSTTASQYEALKALAPSKDSLSSLLREIIEAYLNRASGKPQKN
jgi:hypothetical protein